MSRIKCFSSSSLWLKNYLMMSRSKQCIRENVYIIFCTWVINASNLVISLTISTMTMNKMCVPG